MVVYVTAQYKSVAVIIDWWADNWFVITGMHLSVHLGLSKMQLCESGTGPVCKLTETYYVSETCELYVGMW
jgi:hypothetical protein